MPAFAAWSRTRWKCTTKAAARALDSRWFTVLFRLRGDKEHFCAHVLLHIGIGLFTWILLNSLHHALPLESLERLGADAAMRVFAAQASLPAPPDIVLVPVDAETSARWAQDPGTSRSAKLVALIKAVRAAGPDTVVVDLVFEDTIAASTMAELRHELESQQGGRVLLPMPMHPTDAPGNWLAEQGALDGLRGLGHVQFGSALLHSDSDGVVRLAPRPVCLRIDGRWEALQPLAALARAGPGTEEKGLESPSCPGPGAMAPTGRPILYYLQSQGSEPGRRGIIPALAVPDRAAELKGAIVVIGQTGPEAWDDIRLSPLGPMPGTYIQANAILSAGPAGIGEEQQEAEIRRLEFSAIAAGALVFATFGLLQRRAGAWVRRRIGGHVWAWVLDALLAIAGVVLFVVPLVVVLFGIGVMWTAIAASALRTGAVIGTLVPLFAICVEAALHAGKPVVTALEDIAGRVVGRLGWLALASLLLLMLAGAARSQTVGRISAMTGEAQVERAGKTEPAHANDQVHSYDTVIVPKAGSEVILQLYGKQQPPLIGPTEYLVPPPSDPSLSPGALAAVASFWQTATATRPGLREVGAATHVWRGLADDGATTEPLRPIEALGTSDSVLLPTGQGLALAWRGGVPPYQFRVEADDDGAPLGRASVGQPFLWWPDWQMPQRAVRVRVVDAGGHGLSGRIVPGAVLPLRIEATGNTRAILLFETGGERWRLEAFRQLVAAAAADPVAAQAVRVIRAAQ